MAAIPARRSDPILISTLEARQNFGSLLDRIEGEGRSLVIAKRGTPRAVLLSIGDYVRLAAPEPEVLKLIGHESQANGTTTISSLRIDAVVRAARTAKTKR